MNFVTSQGRLLLALQGPLKLNLSSSTHPQQPPVPAASIREKDLPSTATRKPIQSDRRERKTLRHVTYVARTAFHVIILSHYARDVDVFANPLVPSISHS